MKSIDLRGATVPTLGFGTWQLEGDDAYDPVRAALDIGYRHIDTAQMYGNEEAVGRAIADSDVDRDDVFLTTKVWRDRAKRDDVISSTEESLRKLGVEHLDLLLIHWPAEEVASVEETVEALTKLQEDGKTRLIGVSNYTPDLLKRAVAAGPVAVNQVEHHPYLGQADLLSMVREHDLMLTAYSPIAQGEVLKDDTITAIAEEHGKNAVQVTLRWLVQQDRVSAIPRSSDRAHIESNFSIFDFELSDDEVSRIDQLARGERLIDPGFAPEW